MLNIFYSQTISGNNNEIFNRIKNLRDTKCNHVIFTPDRCTLSIEESIFEHLNTSCVFDVNITTLTRFTNTILQKNAYKFKVLTKPLAIAIIKKILVENENSFSTIKKAIKFNGFSSTLYDTLSMFKSCGVKVNNISTNYKNTSLNFKLSDLKLVYEKYESFLSDEWTDSFNKINLLIKILTKTDCENTHFYFIGFDDFTPIMYSLIARLSKLSMSVNVATAVSYIDKINNKNIYLNNVYLNLLDIAKIEDIQVTKIYCPLHLNKQFNILANNLFSYNINKSDYKNNHIEIFKCNNLISEIDFVIKYILQLQSKNVDLNDIALVVPELDSCKDFLADAFNKNNINHFFDSSEPISTNLVIRFYNDLFSLFKSNFLKGDVFDFLTNYTNLDKLLISSFQNFINSIGVNYKKILEPVGYANCEGFKLVYEKLETIKQLYNELKSVKNFGQIINRLISFSANFGFNNHVNEIGEKFKINNNIIEYKKLNNVVEKTNNGFTDLFNVLNNYETDMFEAFNIISAYFENITVVIPPIVSGSVFIADLVKSYITHKKYAIFIGCEEGNMPKIQTDLGLISDNDILTISNDIKLTPTINIINKRNKFNVYEKLLSFDNLILTYVCVNESGENILPCEAIKNIIAIFPEIKINNATILQEVNGLCDQSNLLFNNSSINFLSTNLISMIKNSDIEFDNEIYLHNISNLFNALKKININNAITYIANKNANFLASNLNEKLFFKTNIASVSEFESYFNCPYKHFVDYGLKLKQQEMGEFSAIDYGNILHEYVKAIVPQLKKINYNHEKINEFGTSELQRILDKEKYLFLTKNLNNKNDIKSLFNEIKRINLALIKIEESSEFVTSNNLLEMAFEMVAPIKINNKIIKIKGIIDRVDVCNNEFRIIDYKTGNAEFSDYTDVVSGKKLQLIVYMSEIKNKLKLKPVGAFYLPLRNTFDKQTKTNNFKLTGIITDSISSILQMDKNLINPSYQSDVLNLKTDKNGKITGGLTASEQEFDKLINYVFKLINLGVASLEQGNIMANPLKIGDSTPCEYCEYLGMCKFNEKYGGEFRKVNKATSISELEEETI